MPLLRLPSELLREIIVHSALPSVWLPPWKSDNLCPTGGLLSLAATCRHLRSLTLEFIYSKVMADSDSAILSLHKHLTKYPHIAAFIRELHLVPAGTDNKPLQEILMNCTGLRCLGLGGGDGRNPITNLGELLHHLPPESKKSLKSLHLEVNLIRLLDTFKFLSAELGEGYFGKIQEMSVVGNDYHTYHSASEVEGYLLEAGNGSSIAGVGSVRTLRLKLPFNGHFGSGEWVATGQCFAKLTPNVNTLCLDAAATCLHSILSTYIELGTNLTELTINGTYSESLYYDHHPHICEIIPKLSRNLKKFSMSPVRYARYASCHQLFGKATDWPQLTELNISYNLTCAGIKPDLLHTVVTELTQARPQASLKLTRFGSVELVLWNIEGQKLIKSPEDFEWIFNRPHEVADPPMEEWGDFDEIYDDDHDYEHDIEDTIERYYEDNDYEDDIGDIGDDDYEDYDPEY